MGVRIENNLFYVESKNLSLIIENRNGYLLLKHLGKTIKNYKGSNSVYERDHAFSGNPTATNRTFSLDTQRQIFGQHGLGDFRKPTIQVQHSVTEVTDFRFVEAKILKGQNGPQGLPSPHSMDDTETLVLMLEDSKAQLSLTLYYTTFNNDATITSYSKLDNNSNQEVVIHKDFSFMADFPAADYEIVTLQGAYAREKTVRRQQVEQGIFSISSNRGASGHAQTPALLLCEQGVTEDAGNVFAIQLMYSGNFEAFVQKNQLNEVRVAIGINPENFSWKLAPEEYFETPVALVTHSDQGLTGISHESQNFVLKHIILSEFSKKERPILINNWEATYFDFQREKLLELADEAKKVGIELFVLDDGWFGNRFDDNRALGDWVVNEEKLGGSLESLISAIHERGLQFGLWLEPEMISVDSDLYRQHPDWAIQVPDYEHTYSRNQLVLNLANPQVVEYLKSVLDQLLSYHEIDYIKWDMNRNITKLGNGLTYLETQMQSHQYMLGLYELVSYLTEKHSHILFESCSGGGGRNDLGMIRYFLQVATTGLALFGLGACSNYGKSADGTVTIEYFNQKKEMTKTLEEITRDFEKENPKIKVKVVNVPNAGEVLKTRVLAGDVPDVVNIYPQSIELQEWAKAGVFEDLSNKDYLKRVKNGYAEKYAVNEKVYNVPFTANAYGIYYNKDKFEELGLKVPETWDEFEQLVKDIVAKGQTPFGIAGADAWTLNGYNQLAFATATGGGKEANQYLRYSQPNAIKLSDPIMKDDIKVMDILRINGSKQKNWEGAGYTDVIGAFARGDVLMTPNGSWAITAINEQKPNFKIGTFMIPGKEKGQSLTVGAGDLAWSISATTKHPKEANAFVEYMTRPEVMQKYYDVDGSPTAIEGVKQAGEDSPLAGMTEYAFTDRHLVWLQQYWTSEADFHTLTMNYVLTGDKQGMVNDLNAFFNPMKADVD
ncbi:alpha-galactosidase [Streptococcus pneumoniae]|nr:alpha-galactosidase [Streptococcus pneumoniae]